MAEKFRAANLALKEARKADSHRFSSSRDNLNALTQKRRNAPTSFSSENPPASDDSPFPQYDPADEAGFDAPENGFSSGDANLRPGIRFAGALESVPALVRDCLRERFHAEFSTVRFAKKVFSFREDNATESAEPEDDSTEDPDEI